MSERITDQDEVGAENAAWRAYLQGRHAHHATDAFRAGWLAGRDWRDHAAARELAEARARVRELEDVAGLGYWTLKVMADDGNEDAAEIVRQMDTLLPQKPLARPEPTEPVGVAEPCRGCAQPVICSCPPRPRSRPAEPVAREA